MSTDLVSSVQKPDIASLAQRASAALAAQGTVNPDLPAHLQQAVADGATGLDGMQGYVQPPRLKVVQKQSASELLAICDPGSVLAMPQKHQVAGMLKDAKTGRPTEAGERFAFMPLFFYAEFCLWEPNGIKPCIVDRSFDPQSGLALQAKARKKIPHPTLEGKERRFVEHLNFIVMLLRNQEFESLPVILSFSRGEYSRGTGFMSMIQMRKAPLMGLQFIGQVHGPSSGRKNADGEWYGIDVENPNADDQIAPVVMEPERFNQYRDLHAFFAEKHRLGMIRADYDDGDSTVAGNTAPSGTSEY